VIRQSWPLAISAVVCVTVLAMPAPVAGQAQAGAAGESPALAIQLPPHLVVHRDRATIAAQHALLDYGEWLGPAPVLSVLIQSEGTADSARRDTGIVRVALPQWSTPRAMEVESQVAFGIARLWWPGFEADLDSRRLADGLSWYIQSRTIERWYAVSSPVPDYSDDSARFFGGAWPWPFRILPLDRWTAGLGRAEFLRAANGGSWPTPGRRPPHGFDPLTPRIALAIGTIERLVGWPSLQGALRVLASAAAIDTLTVEEAVGILSAAVGQDLAWLITPALDPAQSFDYRLESLSTAPGVCADRTCYTTRVVAARRGTAAFSGTRNQRAGDYQAGDALELRVTFADRQSVSVRWDGRDPSRTFEFESPVPAVAAHLDPDRVLLLDASYLDNVQTLEGTTNVSLLKWAARWMVWLQDAALTYSAFS
jgi:hypothetical protein